MKKSCHEDPLITRKMFWRHEHLEKKFFLHLFVRSLYQNYLNCYIFIWWECGTIDFRLKSMKNSKFPSKKKTFPKKVFFSFYLEHELTFPEATTFAVPLDSDYFFKSTFSVCVFFFFFFTFFFFFSLKKPKNILTHAVLPTATVIRKS